jgi:hypothetical protein
VTPASWLLSLPPDAQQSCAVSAKEEVPRVWGDGCPARAKQARRHLQKLSTTLRPAENHVRSPSLDPTANALPTTAERSPTENGGFSATRGIGALQKCAERRGFDAGRFAIVAPAASEASEVRSWVHCPAPLCRQEHSAKGVRWALVPYGLRSPAPFPPRLETNPGPGAEAERRLFQTLYTAVWLPLSPEAVWARIRSNALEYCAIRWKRSPVAQVGG